MSADALSIVKNIALIIQQLLYCGSMEDHEAIRALQALAQDHRLVIFRLLVRQGPDGLAAGEIARAVGISATSTSFHLKELDRAGLVVAQRDGRFVRYAVHIAAMRALLSFLTEDCCDGRPELCGAALAATGPACNPASQRRSRRKHSEA